jgi:hypothetical protein
VPAFHATPDGDLTYLLETVTVDGARPAIEAEVLQRLGGWSMHYGLRLCGHTHLQRSMRLSTGPFVVNPGRAGPRQGLRDDDPLAVVGDGRSLVQPITEFERLAHPAAEHRVVGAGEHSIDR